MAGGFGTRLKPLTSGTPKPMLEVKGKPMLMHTIERASRAGFKNFVLILHYLPRVIMDFFGDGKSLGVQIQYVVEESPLGTAGGLGLLPAFELIKKAIVVSNGDVITNIDYLDFVHEHLKQKSFATMAVKEHRLVNEFGTVETSGSLITGFREKPVTVSNINAGVYVLSPNALSLIQRGEKVDMPEIFERSIAAGNKNLAYYLYEIWDDIGRPDDLVRANKEY